MTGSHPLRPAVLLAAAAILAAHLAQAQAQAQKHPSPSVTILEDPATAAFRKALNTLSPALAAATRWQTTGKDDAGALTASSVTIDLPWNTSRIVAGRLTVGDEEVSLGNVRLENAKGSFSAGTISGPVGAFRALLAFAFGGETAGTPLPAAASSTLRVENFRLAAKKRDRDGGHFSSSWSGASLAVDGLRCAPGKASTDACALLLLSGFRAKALNARATFAGEAGLQVGSVSFALSGDGKDDWPALKALFSNLARKPDSAGQAIGADFSVKDLHLTTARRSDDTADGGSIARVDVDEAALSVKRDASGGIRLRGTLASDVSPVAAKGTPLWPALADAAKKTGASEDTLLPISATLQASYGDGHLALTKLSANLAGLFDMEGSADATGLKAFVDGTAQAGDKKGGHDLTALAGVAVGSFSLVMHDTGMSELVETAFGAWPAELLREATGTPEPDAGGNDTGTANLMTLMMGGADMRSGLKAILRKAAVERASGILEALRKDGKVDLHCASTPACIALAIGSTN